MKTSFSKHLILCFILTLPSSKPPHVEASVLWRRYIGIRYELNWKNSGNMCNRRHQTLATIANGLQALQVAKACGNSTCWIGLHKDEDSLDNWRWVDGQQYTEQDWNTGKLRNKLGEISCAAIDRGEMLDLYCRSKQYYVCQFINLVLVKEKKTWEDAIEHCRLFQTKNSFGLNLVFDLLTLHTEEELAYVQGEVARTQTDEVWIGLRWLSHRWLWMDGRPEGGMPVCPVNGMNCGTLSETGKQARHCGEKRNFFCYQRPEI